MSPTKKIRSGHLRLLTLAGAGATLVQAAHENPFIGQQFLINDQTFEPYEFPPAKFVEISAKVPSIETKYPIQGYNIFTTAPRGQFVSEAVEGWQIQVRLTTNISLEGAEPLFLGGDTRDTVDDSGVKEDDGGEDFCEDDGENPELDYLRNQVFDAVLISLLPPSNLVSTEKGGSFNNSSDTNSTTVNKDPEGAASSTGWTVCAAVWVTGLFMENSTTNANSSTPAPSSSDMSPNNSSSCAGLVSDQCITDVIAEFNSAPGGNCKNRTLPRSCQTAFVGHDDTLGALSLAETLVSAPNDIFTFSTPIFAASTYPRGVEDDRTAEALKPVTDWVFPIVMSWTPPGGGATQSHLSCVAINRALEATAPPATPGDGPSPTVVNSGVGSNYGVSAWGVFIVVGAVMGFRGLL